MFWILIDSEAGPIRSEFEQNTARLGKINRLKPEAVNLRTRAQANTLHNISHGDLLRGIPDTPGNVMCCTRSPPAPCPIRCQLDFDQLPRFALVNRIAMPPLFDTERGKT